MTAMGQVVLVLGLLVSAHCEVRVRDPEVEEEEAEELRGRAPGGGGGGGGLGSGGFGSAALHPHLNRLHLEATETPPLGERGNYVSRTGNRCAFVQSHVVTVAVACGTEKYTIKSQSPCPSGIPGCQLVLYKLSTRPVYTQKQKVLTSLRWRCCPGHGGHNCEDSVPDPQPDSGSWALSGGPEGTGLRGPDVEAGLQHQQGDPNREQNDHQASVGRPYDASYPNNLRNATDTHEHRLPDAVEANDPQYPQAPAALPIPYMMALVLSQLQPVLEGFNRSLEQLSRQVEDLAHDVARLKSGRREAEPPEAAEERLDTKLDEAFQHISEVRRQMEGQRVETNNRLQSQHAMLHYNLTSFKADVDMKLKRQQKLLQVSLQAMNTTLTELRPDQDQDTEARQEDRLPLPTLPPPRPPQSSDPSALWLAIERLDNMVVNNTVKVSGLMEDGEVTSGNVQRLRWDLKELEKQINQTARNSQILFMETGLEVEDAKVTVLRRVEELARNLTQQDKQLRERDKDIDDLYTYVHQNHSAGDCDCKGLGAAVARLEEGVVKVTALAHKNRMALGEDAKGGAVEALQRGLQQVKESLASEQTRTRTLDHSVTRLNGSVAAGLAEISGLKERDKNVREKMQRLSGSFTSLLKDAVRHSNVLELLLGEEVLEFLEWPIQDQEANSIPALKEQLRLLQEQLAGHDLSLASPGAIEEVPSADQPSSSSTSSHVLPDDWLPGSLRSGSGASARERQLLLPPDGRRPEHRGDGSDLWNLEKTVEELGLKVLQLAEKPCPCPNTVGGTDAKLQAEVTGLKRQQEEHLRVFKNVFSNADVLAASDATLELDKLWQLVKSKEKKRGGGREGSGQGGSHHSRREVSDVVPVLSGLSEDALLFVGRSLMSVSDGVVTFKVSLNQGRFYSDAGTFRAPVDGVYAFVLTLDLRPGPAHVVLRRGSGGALVTLHRQEVREAGPVTGVGLLLLRKSEEVKLELRGGARAESEDNVFVGMLLHRTT